MSAPSLLRSVVVVLVASTAAALVSLARADTVILKDGTEISGKVVETVEGEYIVVQGETGKKETIPWAEVKRVVAASAPKTDKVILKDGTELEGTVVEQKEGEYVVVQTSTGGKETIPWSEVKRVVLAPGKSAPTTTATATTATTTATTASAEPAAPEPAKATSGVRTHDGFYFRAGLGVGIIAGGNVRTPTAGPLISVSGVGPAVELAFGATVTRGLVLGGGIYGASIPTPSYSLSGQSVDGGAAVISSIGPFADWYTDPAGGLHFQASVGYAVITAGAGSDAKFKFPAQDVSGNGYSLLAGAGYEWWVGDQLSFGVLARIHYVSGSVKASSDPASTDVWVLMPALLATLTYH